MSNVLSIDVVDYFQANTFSDFTGSRHWENYESHIETNTYRLLKLLAASSSPAAQIFNSEIQDTKFEIENLRTLNSTLLKKNGAIRNPVRATFFCFGWIAKKYPHLIKEIQAQGHEVACHGFATNLVYLMSEKEFRMDIRKAKAVLEDLSGVEVIGYRAPCFSINKKSLWTLKVIAEEGFRYDSSIFPIHHDIYGFPEAPRFPFMVNMNGNGSFKFSILSFNTGKKVDSEYQSLNFLLEFPLSTTRLFGKNLAISNGDYSRLFAYFNLKKIIQKINPSQNWPFIFHLHPWGLEYKKQRGSEKTENRLIALLKSFSIFSFKDILDLYSNPIEVVTKN